MGGFKWPAHTNFRWYSSLFFFLETESGYRRRASNAMEHAGDDIIPFGALTASGQ